jgi:hypothetical protein
MYSKEGVITSPLCTAPQMCVDNYITTCGCADGNISAPAGAHTKLGRCLTMTVTGIGSQGLEWLGLFSLSGSKLQLRVTDVTNTLK